MQDAWGWSQSGKDVSGLALLLLLPASAAFVLVFTLTAAVDLVPVLVQGGPAPWQTPPSIVYRVPAVVASAVPVTATAATAPLISRSAAAELPISDLSVAEPPVAELPASEPLAAEPPATTPDEPAGAAMDEPTDLTLDEPPAASHEDSSPAVPDGD